MSYCVNCGVELDPGAARCPLCGTPAWKPDPDAPSYFPTKPAEVPPASRRASIGSTNQIQSITAAPIT